MGSKYTSSGVIEKVKLSFRAGSSPSSRDSYGRKSMKNKEVGSLKAVTQQKKLEVLCKFCVRRGD